MTRESFVFIVGFMVFFTPFFGIPSDWKEVVYILAGILLMITGYSLRRSFFLRSIDTGNGERRSDAFVENTGLEETHELSQKTR